MLSLCTKRVLDMSRLRVLELDESFSNEGTSITESDTKETEVYLSLPQLDLIPLRDEDVLDWWKIHQTKFPNLSKMSRQFLALPASSSRVERLFSASGKMHGDKRKRLKKETLQSLLFVKKILDNLISPYLPTTINVCNLDIIVNIAINNIIINI